MILGERGLLTTGVVDVAATPEGAGVGGSDAAGSVLDLC